MPNGSGGQNNTRYAYFNNARRLAVEINGHVTVYDTLDNQIGGVSQQQGSGGSLTFTSQYGTIPVASLPVISVDGMPPNAHATCPATDAWQPESAANRDGSGSGHLRQDRASGRLAAEGNPFPGRVCLQEGRRWGDCNSQCGFKIAVSYLNGDDYEFVPPDERGYRGALEQGHPEDFGPE